MTYEANEELIAQQLSARGLSGLFELLQRLKGRTLNQRYTLLWLYAVGGQSILYLAEGPSREMAIVKMALLPYHRAAYMDIEDIYRARQRLEKEAHILQRFRSTVLPEFYELIHSSNPLHSSARGKKVVNREPYLVMEFIQGQTLIDVAKSLHRTSRPCYDVLEQLAWQVAITAIDFSLKISKRESPCLYSDFTPLNIIITNNPDVPVRILDAGSLIPLQHDPTVVVPFTWAYIPLEYFEAYDSNEPLWPTSHYVMYTLGKVLWQILTNSQPHPAEEPNLLTPKLKNYSSSLQKLIADLIERRYSNFKQLKLTIKSAYVSEQQPRLSLTELLSVPEEVPTKKMASMNGAPDIQIPVPPGAVTFTKLHQIRSDDLQVVKYSPDGRYLAIAYRNRIELWNASTLHRERCFRSPHSTLVVSLDFDTNGRYLAAGSNEGVICLWHTGQDTAIWSHQDVKLNGSVALNSQGDILVAANKWSAVAFHPQRTIQTEMMFEGIVDQCGCFALAQQQPLLAVGGLWGIRLWNTQTHTEVGEIRLDRSLYVTRIFFTNSDKILTAILSDAQTLIECSIVIFDLSYHKFIGEARLPAMQFTGTQFVAKDHFIFAGSLDGSLYVWNRELTTEHSQQNELGQILSLDFDPTQQTLAVATSNGEVSIYYLHNKDPK